MPRPRSERHRPEPVERMLRQLERRVLDDVWLDRLRSTAIGVLAPVLAVAATVWWIDLFVDTPAGMSLIVPTVVLMILALAAGTSLIARAVPVVLCRRLSVRSGHRRGSGGLLVGADRCDRPHPELVGRGRRRRSAVPGRRMADAARGARASHPPRHARLTDALSLPQTNVETALSAEKFEWGPQLTQSQRAVSAFRLSGFRRRGTSCASSSTTRGKAATRGTVEQEA